MYLRADNSIGQLREASPALVYDGLVVQHVGCHHAIQQTLQFLLQTTEYIIQRLTLRWQLGRGLILFGRQIAHGHIAIGVAQFWCRVAAVNHG
uniref:IP16415p n=1 Tax=Drosophila melanogaster TaxID=7227 RepID=Q1RL15_DROME|nr:IP16415p [Drosophila melanogaster]